MRDVNSKNLARLENNDINNKSALVKHVYSEKHHMNWNNSKILAKEADYIKRRFLESFFIHFNNDAFNAFKDLVSSVVEWLMHRTDDQHGLGSKPTCAILLCSWERHFTALSPAWWS